MQGIAQRFSVVFGPLWQATRVLLWPEKCPFCGVYILPEQEGLCKSCWQDLAEAVSVDYCRRCGHDVSPYGIIGGRCGFCQDTVLSYDGIVRVGNYQKTLRSMILSLKFQEQTQWLAQLSAMLGEAFMSSSFRQDIDWLVPVPLHWRRRLARGFNQSHLLAKKMRCLEIPISTDLVRIRYTRQQWNLTIAQRQRNVKGAFAIRQGHPFEGKNILLIDDISTSGATLSECAKTLKGAGAQKVYAAVLATAFHES